MAARNPFPGMNPYLEARWRDVHARLVAYAADQLQPRLPDDLRARMQERVFIESVEATSPAFYPDVQVCEGRGARAMAPEGPGRGEGPVVMAEPLVIHVPAVERGRYDDIDYAEPLDPPLPGDDAAWARGMVEAVRGRPAGA